jgi:hypothetical protein
MTTVLVVGCVWLVVAVAVLIVLGRAIRDADRRDDRVGLDLGQAERARRRARSPVRPSAGIPDLAELESWYRAGDDGGRDGGPRSADPA